MRSISLWYVFMYVCENIGRDKFLNEIVVTRIQRGFITKLIALKCIHSTANLILQHPKGEMSPPMAEEIV